MFSNNAFKIFFAGESKKPFTFTIDVIDIEKMG